MFVKRILIETFNYGVENKAKIFDSLKYPGFGIFITSLLSQDDSEIFTIKALILLLVNVYFYILFTVNCHRLFLEEKVPNGLIESLKWNNRSTNFLITTFALGIAMAAIVAPIVIISLASFGTSDANLYIATSIIMLPVGYVFGRFSLILPATAIDMDNSWSTAWDISKEHGWSLCFLISIFPILTGFVINSISPTSIVSRILIAMLSIVVLFYEISILSNSYKVLYIQAKATQQGAVDKIE